MDGITYIDYLDELDWKISADYEAISIISTLSFVSVKFIGKLVQDEKNLDGFNCIDHLD